MGDKKDDLDTHSADSDSTLSIPSGSDSNRSESPGEVVGNRTIEEENKKDDHHINIKHSRSQSSSLVRQQLVSLC